MDKFKSLRTFRLILAILLLSAVIIRFFTYFVLSPAYRINPIFWWNYFSYFTVMTNIIIGVFFLYIFINKNKVNYYKKTVIRHMLLIYIFITALVYMTVLLPLIKFNNFYEIYADMIMHPLAFILYLADYIIDYPKEKLKHGFIIIVVVYPLFYAIYSIIRGIFIKWYPYFFLDPVKLGSYYNLILVILIFFLIFIILGFVIFIINKILLKKIN